MSTPGRVGDPWEALRSELRGELLLPSSSAYEPARKIWNAAIDRRPAAIARCRDVADVVACVRHARDRKLPLTVRGGGHSAAGSSVQDDALMIDLSAMRAVHVDPVARTIWAQGGAQWGDVDHASQFFGLAVPGGFVSTTGVGGFTLGGGIAWTSRKLGLACDNLIAAEVVTARGDVVRASSSENSDLFWALRGAGGNFGVVTSLTFQGQSVGPIVYGGFRIYPAERARELLRLVADLYRRTPEEFNVLVVLGTAPPAPFVPAELHGKRVVVVAACCLVPPEKGPEVAKELLSVPGAAVDHMGPIPYVALQSAFDPLNPPGTYNYWKSLYADSLPDAAIDALLDRWAKVPSPLTELHFQYFGGAVSRIGGAESAVGNRNSPYLYNLIGKWESPEQSPTVVGFIRELWEALRPSATGGVYLNFLTDRSAELTRASYGDEIYRRLAQVKRKYDPENLFKGSHNITPAPG